METFVRSQMHLVHSRLTKESSQNCTFNVMNKLKG